jgi:dihydroneopterin aldolase
LNILNKDVIRILGLRFVSKHGVRPEEKIFPQTFEVDIEICLDLSIPSETDDIIDTVNYSTVATIVRNIVEGATCNLIEKIAGKIVNDISKILDEGSVITIRVRKPSAPLEMQFRTVEVELKRTVLK